MTPDRVPHLEQQVDYLLDVVRKMHVDIVREIRDTVDDALDRHVVQCPQEARIAQLETHGGNDCPLRPRVEIIERELTRVQETPARSTTAWEKWGPWAVAVAGFCLGAVAASEIIDPGILKALLPF